MMNTKLIDVLKKKILAVDSLAYIDGPIDPESYFANNLRILWLLQEPYGNDGKSHDQTIERDNATCLADICTDRTKDGAKTLSKIVRLAHSLKLGTLFRDDVFENKEAYQSFRESTAIINMKKTPNPVTDSSNTDFCAAKAKWGDTVLAQIEAYDPTVIIGGGTLKYHLDGMENFRANILGPFLCNNGDESLRSFKLLDDTVNVADCYYMQHQHLVVMPGRKRLFLNANHPCRESNGLYVAELLLAIMSHLKMF